MSQVSSRLRVEADLSVEIDGQPARLQGQGDELLLVLEQEGMLAGLLDGNRPAARQLANALSLSGLTLAVVNKDQPVVLLGHGVHSRVSRLVTGSPHIAPVDWAALVALLRAYFLDARGAGETETGEG